LCLFLCILLIDFFIGAWYNGSRARSAGEGGALLSFIRAAKAPFLGGAPQKEKGGKKGDIEKYW
jgi:hypothetical protein